MNGLESLGYEFEFENGCITIYKSKDGLSRIYYNDCEAWKETKKKKFTRVSLYASEIEALNELMNDNKEKKLLNLLKDKKVDIGYVAMMISNCETQELESGMKFNVNDYIQEITDCYNTHIAIQQNIEYKFLMQEDMTLFLEWLRGIKLCHCYDNGRCNGTREREECYCKGNTENCTFYKGNK